MQRTTKAFIRSAVFGLAALCAASATAQAGKTSEYDPGRGKRTRNGNLVIQSEATVRNSPFKNYPQARAPSTAQLKEARKRETQIETGKRAAKAFEKMPRVDPRNKASARDGAKGTKEPIVIKRSEIVLPAPSSGSRNAKP